MDEPGSSTSPRLPRVSIITVVYNGQQVLERTIRSVAAQTYAAIEYIVVDGNSTDGTLDLIRRYEDRPISRWVSEPDKGIYDAMNKGLAMATGEYVWFMNAGDTIYAPDTLEIALAGMPQADVYYGEAELVSPEGRAMGLRQPRPPKLLSWRAFRTGMSVSHQAFIIRRALAGQYNLDHRYCADIDWVIQGLKRAQKIHFTGTILCTFLLEGFSAKNYRKSWKDRFKVLTKHYGLVPNLLNHAFIAMRYLARKVAV